LANDRGFVTRFLETLWQEPFAGVQSVRGDGRNHRRLQPVTEWITASHQGGARWGAHRLNVELGELCASPRERVDVRRLDIRAPIKADIFPPKVVCDDVDN